MSRELHDEIGQLLTALRILIRSGAFSRTAADELIDEIITRVREIAAGLRPPMLEELGLRESLTWHCDRFAARTGVRVHLLVTGLSHRYPAAVELAMFRFVQEALTNVARHAGAPEAWVLVRARDGHMAGVVLDRGAGFDPEARPPALSTGLAGMRDRAISLGGRLRITSKPGRGTRICLRIPTRVEGTPSRSRCPDEDTVDHHRPRGRSSRGP